MKLLSRSFAALLPILAFIFSIALLLGTAALHYYALKHAAHGSDSASIGTTPSHFVIRSDSFLRFAFTSASMGAIKPITILNAPAHFVDLLISYIVSRKPFWFPSSVGPAIWTGLTLPIFAVPAWRYVGLGIDALLGRRRISTVNGVSSLGLVMLFGTLAAVLRFGLAQDPGLVPGLPEGFTLWTLLFATPFAAWLRQKIVTGPR